MIYEIEGLVPNQTDVNGVTYTGSVGVTPVPSNITTDTLLVVTIATDPDPIYNITTELSYQRITEDGYSRISEQGTAYLPNLDMSWTDTFGISFTENILINL